MKTKGLLDVAFTEAAVETIMGAINAKVDLTSTTQSGMPPGRTKQSNMFLDCYLLESQWGQFTNNRNTQQNNLFLMATILRAWAFITPTRKLLPLAPRCLRNWRSSR